MAQQVSCRRGPGICLVLGVLMAVGIPGCGPPKPELSEVFGKVTFDGDPVEEGSIAFVPVEGTTGPTAGGVITAGSYDVTERGPAPGKYRVEIRASRKTGRQIEAGTPSPPGTMVDEIEHYIPAKYNTSSELTVDITTGRNEHNFPLEP